MTDNPKDLWETPKDLLTALTHIYHLDIDLCALPENTKFKQFSSDILNVPHDWLKGNRGAFMNPPYSDPAPFIQKAWELSEFCQVVVLIPSSLMHNKYMDFLDVNRGRSFIRHWRTGVSWEPLSSRTKFNHPVKKATSPAFGCALLILNKPPVL